MELSIEKNAALTLARLHLLSGKHQLQQGCLTAGLTALYDSVVFGMRYYIAKHECCAGFLEGTNLWDVIGLFQVLTRSGVFEDPLMLNRFSLMVERALWQQSLSSDTNAIIAEAEKMLVQLGVMPLD